MSLFIMNNPAASISKLTSWTSVSNDVVNDPNSAHPVTHTVEM